MSISNIASVKKIEDISKDKSSIKIIKGTVISIILSLILLTIYAALLSYTSISESTIVPVIITITGISILIGSSISSMHIKKQGMLNGALVGLVYMLTIYILSSIFLSSFEININSSYIDYFQIWYPRADINYGLYLVSNIIFCSVLSLVIMKMYKKKEKVLMTNEKEMV